MASKLLASSLNPTAPPAPASRLTLASLRRSLPGIEWLAAVLFSLAAASLHLALCLRHYPLWRDEANAVQLATLPAFADTWKYLPYDSIPLLFHGLLRAWVTFTPAGDASLRVLGMLIGLGVLGAAWVCVRIVGGGLPILSAVLLGFNPLCIRYGDSMRAYGLGMMLALLTFAAVWRVVQSPRPGRVILAVGVGLLSVNTLFHNAVLLLAVCAAGALVVARERRWRHAALLLALGVPAALSLPAYHAMFQEQHRWGFLFHSPLTLRFLGAKVWAVMGEPDPLTAWVWALAGLGLAALAVPRLRADRASAFAWTTLLLGIVGYTLFLKALHYYAQPWYFLAVLTVAAVCLDVLGARLLLAAGPRGDGWRAARLAVAFAFVMLTCGQTAQALRQRPTNADQLAAAVAQRAGPEDLIVHLRWECAIPFGRYYHGPTPQVTIPPITDHRFHRYDLILQQMDTPHAEVPVKDAIARTLQAGHQVYLVGMPVLPVPGHPLAWGPIRQDAGGRAHAGSYYLMWVQQVSEFISQHATGMGVVPIRSGEPISDYERLPLYVVAGWTDQPTTPGVP